MLDHDAIYKAYPSITQIDDSFVDYGLDKDGNKVTIVQSNIDAARVTLDNEATATAYQRQRTGQDMTSDTIYPNLGEQLDLLFKDIAAGTLTTSGNFYTALKAVKDKYPKPS